MNVETRGVGLMSETRRKVLKKKKDKKIGPEVVGEIEERVRNSEVTKAFWC